MFQFLFRKFCWNSRHSHSLNTRFAPFRRATLGLACLRLCTTHVFVVFTVFFVFCCCCCFALICLLLFIYLLFLLLLLLLVYFWYHLATLTVVGCRCHASVCSFLLCFYCKFSTIQPGKNTATTTCALQARKSHL